MSRCLDIADFKSYQLQTLDDDSRRRIGEHLAVCASCRASFDEFCNNQHGSKSSAIAAGDHTQSVQRGPITDSSPAAIASRHLPRIDGYQITGKLGQGGMGVVYRAVQTRLDRVVALKILPAVVADGPAVERFRREAKAAARLHHTNIVPIYDFGESHDGHYYAMELIEGKPLNEFIRAFAAENISVASQTQLAAMLRLGTAGAAPPPGLIGREVAANSSSSGVISSSSTGRGRAYFRQVARWILDAAEGLHYAHSQGIIHRDIKPGNMILSADGRIMITDFGLAKTADDTSISVVGALIGAIRYLSPEQAMAGRLRLDHRTDIWSLGATLYELLTFHPAFPGTDEKQILSAIITKDPTPPRKLDSHVPAELETICMKTLEKDPDHRYASGRALAEDLQRWLDDMPIVAKRPGAMQRSLKYVKRHRAISTAAAAVCVVAFMSWVFIAGSRAQEVEKLRERARRLEGENNWVEAANHYRKALDIDPSNASVMNNLARSLQEQYDRGNYDPKIVEQALDLCGKARALDPTLTNIDNTYAVLLSMSGRGTEANDILTRNIPKEAPAAMWCNIGAVHFLGGDLPEARRAFQLAIDDPRTIMKTPDGSSEIHEYYHGYHMLAMLELVQGNPQALATIEQGIKLQSASKGKNHFGFYLVKARVLLILAGAHDPLQANAAGMVARGLNPDKMPDRYVERYLALSYLRLNQLENARLAIERSREAKDLPVYTNLLVALAEAKSGNADLAQAALAEAERQWPVDLRTPGSIKHSRHMGMIWFESADELFNLRREVESLVSRSP